MGCKKYSHTFQLKIVCREYHVTNNFHDRWLSRAFVLYSYNKSQNTREYWINMKSGYAIINSKELRMLKEHFHMQKTNHNINKGLHKHIVRYITFQSAYCELNIQECCVQSNIFSLTSSNMIFGSNADVACL